MVKLFKGNIMRTVLAAVVGASFIFQAGVSEAGVLYPNSGNQPKPVKKDTVSAEAAAGKDTRPDWQKQEASAARLKVLVGSELASAAISASNDYLLVEPVSGKRQGDFKANAAVNITVSKGYLQINGKDTACTTLRLQAQSGTVKFNRSTYHGTLIITSQGSHLQVVNELSMEDYIKGVLPAEMSPAWPNEALKAQAVAARTFALYTKKQGQHRGSGYDLCDSTHCQVYEGVSGEDEATNGVVDATAGLVMEYQGKVIYAPFHASSGGATENSEDVWGNRLPYLRSVADDDSKSPYHNWTVRFTVEQVQKKLQAASKGVGKLQSITMEPLSTSGSVTARTPSGKVYGTRFVGSSGTITLTGEQMRSIFGLKSAMFTVRTERIAALPTAGSKAKAKAGSKPAKNDKLDTAPAAMTGSSLKISGVDAVIFDGHGFGHGLGMAQYGAKAMAEKGQKYEAILKHYYTGVELVKLY